MVERFNGRISEIVDQSLFGSRQELESTLRNYLKIYNHNISQRALDNETPIQAMKKWQQTKPELFTKRVYIITRRVLAGSLYVKKFFP